jgi:23S rRNA pseudouridine2605 synthase
LKTICRIWRSSMNSLNKPNSQPGPLPAEGIRLQKVLAAAGFGSRRRCEELIVRGRVSVDGRLVTELGTRVDPELAIIRVDDQRIAVPKGSTVVALNKPRGVLTAMSDDRGRPCVGDLVSGADRLFHVGRLDSDTEGLLLLTNDGDLAHRLTHPKFGVEKTYIAEVEGEMGTGEIRRLREGVSLDDRVVEVSSVRLRSVNKGRSIVEVVIHEGRKHVVRRLLAEVGFPVVTLVRSKFGTVTLSALKSGAIRTLTDEEVAALYDAVDDRNG